jgi:hypothetical protein
MNINYGLLGQIAVCWIVLSLVASPYIGRVLRRRRIEAARKHFRDTKPAVVLNRQRLETAVRNDLQDSAYQERARVAESLGFRDDDEESGPWVQPQRKAQ